MLDGNLSSGFGDDERGALRKLLVALAWQSGDLSYVLHADQRRVRHLIREAFSGKARRYVLEIARRWGKSVLLVALCIEEALRCPGGRIVYGAPTLKMLGEFVHPAFSLVCMDAPAGLAPVWNQQESHYNFPNGSWIHLFGADDERTAKRGRGGDARLVVFDEAAFTEVLPTVLNDVFRPALQERLGKPPGLMLLSSSPADIPEHPFTEIAELEEAAGNYVTRSWLDNPLRTDEMRERDLEELAREAGLPVEEYVLTPVYRREYLGQRVVDPLLLGVPEWAAVAAECTVALERPALFRGHEGLDFGGTDPHAALLGYWHAKEGLVIEHEVLLRHDEVNTTFAEAVRNEERACWGVTAWDGTLTALESAEMAARYGDRVPEWLTKAIGAKAQPQPYARFADHNKELMRMFWEVGIAALMAQKQDKQLAVQGLRGLVAEKKLKVHPRCVGLQRQLRTTTWEDHRRRGWARRAGEHGDLVDCLLYMLRDLNRDVPVAPTVDRPSGVALSRALLGETPMARRLLRQRR